MNNFERFLTTNPVYYALIIGAVVVPAIYDSLLWFLAGISMGLQLAVKRDASLNGESR